MRFGVLPGGQIENRSAVVLNGFVAEPPIQLLTVHESLYLVLGVRVKESAANAAGPIMVSPDLSLRRAIHSSGLSAAEFLGSSGSSPMPDEGRVLFTAFAFGFSALRIAEFLVVPNIGISSFNRKARG